MVTTNKGEQIYDSLVLDQYSNSPNMKEFIMCYLAEMDFLFQTIEESYAGRMLEDAVGVQQDIIGIILNEERNVVLSVVAENFGFVGATGATKMAAEATPNDGGVFRSEQEVGFAVTPLTDQVFKRLLKTKASMLNSDTTSVEDMYSCVTILLDRALSNLGVTFPAAKRVQLELAADEVTLAEVALIEYASRWFIPTGVMFTINRT